MAKSNYYVDEELFKRMANLVKSSSIENFKNYYANNLWVMNSNQDSLLHSASEANRKDFVEYFLAEGLEVNHLNRQEKTALEMGSLRADGNKDLLQLLIDAGADVNRQNDYKMTLLMITVATFNWTNFDDFEEISLLHELGADLNLQDKKGRTALMLASKSGNHDAVEALIKLGADPYLENSKGNTAKDVARFDYTREFLENAMASNEPSDAVNEDNLSLAGDASDLG